MLMFRLGEIAKHVGWRAEKDEAAAFVEQDRLVEHLENFRARLVNRDDDDFVVRHAPNNFDYVLGVFGRKTGGWFVKKINVRHPDHIETDVEPFPLAAAQGFFLGTADDRIAAFA